jgi:hypothetical protein
METPNPNQILESFYEKEVLPLYNLPALPIIWQSHDKIGNDTFSHYFVIDTQNYSLVFEDFPSEPHFIAEEGELVLTKTREESVRLTAKQNEPFVENQTGYFSLYKVEHYF